MKPNEADELLRTAPFLRRIVSGIIIDPHAIDDVLQKTFIKAIEASEEKRTMSAWLARVARNFALMSKRAQARRDVHESSKRPPSEPASVPDSIHCRELINRALHAVARLDEPYRRVIMLRFLKGLSAKEIANRLHAPVGTVRTRLRRGLTILRRKLDLPQDDSWLHSPLAVLLLFPRRRGAICAAGAVALVGLIAVKSTPWALGMSPHSLPSKSGRFADRATVVEEIPNVALIDTAPSANGLLGELLVELTPKTPRAQRNATNKEYVTISVTLPQPAASVSVRLQVQGTDTYRQSEPLRTDSDGRISFMVPAAATSGIVDSYTITTGNGLTGTGSFTYE